jgi:hypothetical protein
VWDGTRFQRLEGGPIHAGVSEFTVYRDTLFAIGDFDTIPDRPIASVARWTGNEWQPLSFPKSYDYRMAASDRGLLLTAHIYDSSWSRSNLLEYRDGVLIDLPHDRELGLTGNPTDMCMMGNSVVVVGSIIRAGTVPIHSIALWDDSSWHDVGATLLPWYKNMEQAQVYPVAANETLLYVCYTSPGNRSNRARGISRYDGHAWHTIASVTAPSEVYP